jgi:signal transduction histidine kinase
MSHELRTPLNHITGFAALLAKMSNRRAARRAWKSSGLRPMPCSG